MPFTTGEPTARTLRCMICCAKGRSPCRALRLGGVDTPMRGDIGSEPLVGGGDTHKRDDARESVGAGLEERRPSTLTLLRERIFELVSAWELGVRRSRWRAAEPVAWALLVSSSSSSATQSAQRGESALRGGSDSAGRGEPTLMLLLHERAARVCGCSLPGFGAAERSISFNLKLSTSTSRGSSKSSGC